MTAQTKPRTQQQPTSRFALACAILAAAAPAFAKEHAAPREKASPKVEELVKGMMVDYNTGDFAAALAKATEAYRLEPRPALLFNFGQFHKELHHWERAEFFFYRYLAERPDAPNRATVERLLADVQQKMKESTATAPAPAAAAAPVSAPATILVEAPRTPQAVAPPAPATPAAPAEAVSAPGTTVTMTVDEPNRSHWLAYGLIGGAVLLGIGAGLASIPVYNMNQLNQQVNAGTGNLAYSKVQSADSQGVTFQGVAIGVGIAAALCAGGAALAW